jgi:Protein of unknown function (DUF1592)/Protein of unknown function (DUF1588)/Protein of unknown function (DUF1585)/Protein of unknown function (DUF1595)
MGILSGFGKNGPAPHLTGYYDLPPGPPAVIEFTERLGVKGTLKIHAHGLGRRELRSLEAAAAYSGPGVAIHRVEVTGPLLDTWPPRSQTLLFGKVDPARATLADAAPLLEDFARRAFRRPVTAAETAPFLALVKAQAEADPKQPLSGAMRTGFKAILCAPEFLFLTENPGHLTAWQTAARLSYFLWSAPPDEALARTAADGTLTQPEVLRAQTERLLRDPKAAAFTRHFTGQWLGLRQIDFTTPDKKLYPEFDPLLQESMLQESWRFFDEILTLDLPLFNFVDADFTIVNARLAEFYGIPGVTGQAFRRVALPPGSPRGGVLTQASVLKITANGTTTSPVTRGAWVLRNVMGRAVKPPPPNVPAIEPDIRGAGTIREQLEKHRAMDSCASCHNQMDPPGYVLENFDVLGGWRGQYRSLGTGLRATAIVEGRRVGYKLGGDVDATATLPDGTKLTNVRDLKKAILTDRDAVVLGLAGKLLTYATGAAPEFSDRAVLEDINRRLAPQKHGFRSLIHEIVQSRPFLTK